MRAMLEWQAAKGRTRGALSFPNKHRLSFPHPPKRKRRPRRTAFPFEGLERPR
jgi:hypothetical protein